MNKQYIKMIAAISGLAAVFAITVPLAMPNTATAKLFSWTHAAKVQPADDAPDVPADVTEADQQAAQEAVPAETVVTTADGSLERVQIVDIETTQQTKVVVDKKISAEMQVQADNGQEAWMLDPLEVVRHNAGKYGFSAKDTFTLISKVYQGRSGTGEAYVLVGHGSKYYQVRLTQPNGPGDNKVWVISGIAEAKVIKKTSTSKRPDVGPGVEGLDYSKVIKWQQNVDEGREMWRLDPLQAARMEGKQYGFTDQAVFTMVKQVSSSSIARHGQIDFKVEQNGKTYTMILVRPFGSDEGAIWTVYSVTGKDKPNPQPDASKVLFETNKYEGWKWHKGKGQYPHDIAFATIADYEFQLKHDERIPEFALKRVKDIDYTKNVVLFAYLGTAPSGGYGIGIEKVTMTGNQVTVKVRTRNPAPGEMVTMAITHPADYVLLDRKVVDLWGGVNVTFIDQNGVVLSKNKLVVNHYRK